MQHKEWNRGSSFAQRGAFLRRFLRELSARAQQGVRAIVADGWPEAMARQGLKLHMETWQAEVILEAFAAELSGVGGPQALDGAVQRGGEGAFVVSAPETILHVWPGLPGAGLTPLLFGYLLGSAQTIRPSRKSAHFTDHVLEVWHQVAMNGEEGGGSASLALELEGASEAWRSRSAIFISGHDDTIESVRDFLGKPGHRGQPTVMGYGHKVSFCVVVDDGSDAAIEQARRAAFDGVLWHQKGCFSARAVVFCGARERAQAFSQQLGDAIALWEHRLGAQMSPEQHAARMQALGVAQFTGATCHGEGFGWAQLMNGAWRGDVISPHTLSVHVIPGIEQLDMVLDVARRHVQGVGLYTDPGRPEIRQLWCTKLARMGATRVCWPGRLQAPSGQWRHDGWANVMDLVRVCYIEGPA